jgi:c-di-GMP-binding flagellar brake protein YcgR
MWGPAPSAHGGETALKERRSTTTSEDQARRHLRLEILEYALVCTPHDRRPVHAIVVDIGLGGIQLRSRSVLPVGDLCRLEIGRGSSEEPVVVHAEVRHSGSTAASGLYASGLRFRPLCDAERWGVAELIQQVFNRRKEMLAS